MLDDTLKKNGEKKKYNIKDSKKKKKGKRKKRLYVWSKPTIMSTT